MTTGVLCPVPILQFFDNTGKPAVGGSILTQVGGVNAATYSDVNLTIPLPNPIPLNSRGEASTAAGATSQVFLTPNTIYTFTISDVLGNVLDTPQYINGVQIALTQSYIGQTLYPRSAAEIAASVTPTNYYYNYGIVDRYGTNTTPGTTDMTSAMTAAFSQMVQGGAPVQFLGETYLHKGGTSPIVITNAYQGAVILGIPQQTIIINEGTANACPTIQIYGGSYFYIEGLLISGRAGFSNPGIQIIDDGTYRCGFGRIRKCIGFTNNVQNGFIDIVNANTMYLEDIDYWPTSSDPTGLPDGGATIDNGGQFAAIYMHMPAGHTGGSLSGNCNDIHIDRMNTSGMNVSATFTGSVGGATTGTLTAAWPNGNGVFPFMFQDGEQRNVTISGAGSTTATWTGALSAGTITTAPNGATLLIDGASNSPPAFGTIQIRCVEAERTNTQSVWLRHVWDSSVKTGFFEGSNVTLDNNCNHVTLEHLDVAGGAVLVDGTRTLGGNTRITLDQVDCKSYTADSANSLMNLRNLDVVTTYTDAASYVTRMNCTTPGNTDDEIGGTGLCFGVGVVGATLNNGSTLGGLVGGGVVWTYAPTGAVNGIIMAAPNDTGRASYRVIINESAHSITMATTTIANVADGTNCVLNANLSMRFIWSPHTTIWYHDA